MQGGGALTQGCHRVSPPNVELHFRRALVLLRSVPDARLKFGLGIAKSAKNTGRDRAREALNAISLATCGSSPKRYTDFEETQKIRDVPVLPKLLLPLEALDWYNFRLVVLAAFCSQGDKICPFPP